MEVSGQGNTPAALPPVKNPNTHWVAGWVGPTTYVDVLENKKSFLFLDSNPVLPSQLRSPCVWANKVILRLSWNPEIQNRVQNSLPLEGLLSQMNPVRSYPVFKKRQALAFL
jgi:hypothetical protein